MRQGWEIKKLDEVVEFQRGLTYSKKDEISFSKNIVLRSNNIDLKTNKLDFTELKYINPSIIIAENKTVKKGSLVICMANGSKSHLGKVALIDSDYGYAFGGFMGLIKPKENLNPKFLLHLMTSEMYKKFIDGLSDGVNINNLKFSDLGEFEIPLPPLSEQKRIVSTLDEAFIGIEKAKTNAEQNLKNAKELFESYLQEVFEKKNEGWDAKKLDDLYKIGSSKRVLKSQWKTEGVPFYRGREITRLANNGFVENELYISEEHYTELLEKTGVPATGDIVITAIGTIGNTHIVRDTDKFYFKDASVLWLKKTSDVSSEFIRYFLKSSLFFNQLNKGNGATVDTLTIEKLQSIRLSLPSINEQKFIVNQLDALRIETQKLEEIYQKKLEDLEELKKSILHKAFTGELSTTN